MITNNTIKNFFRLTLLNISIFVGVASLNAQHPFVPYCNWIDGANGAPYWMAAIEHVQISQGTQLLYDKAPDGFRFGGADPGPHGKVNNTPETAIDLVAGFSYRLGVSLSSDRNYNISRFGAWIDYNNNFNFDSDEWLLPTPTHIQLTHTPLTNNSGNPTISPLGFVDFTIPCTAVNGLSRLRIKCAYAFGTISPGNGCANAVNYVYGEAEDIWVNIINTTSLAIDFIAPNEVWATTPVLISNTSATQGFFTWEKGSGVDHVGRDYPVVFPTSGNYDVTLNFQNCFGSNSISKKVVVKDLIQRPEPEFVSNKNNVILGEEFTLYDMTKFGANNLNWLIRESANPSNIQNNSNIIKGDNIFGKWSRAVFALNDLGEFDVSLTAINSFGANVRNKSKYIVVSPFTDILLGQGITEVEYSSGRIIDGGGLGSNYPIGLSLGDPNVNRLLIKPCGADKINLEFVRFVLGNAQHRFFVWDGENKNGTPLHPAGGFTTSNVTTPLTIQASSGAMYVEFDTRLGAGSNLGIIANFTSTLKPPQNPNVFIEQVFPRQAYAKADVTFRGVTSNVLGLTQPKWIVDGFEVPPSFLNGNILTYNFTDAGTYDVCLEVNSCNGDSTYCHQVNVLDPVGRTSLDFEASDLRPALDQVVTLNAIADRANRFQWIIYPPTYTFETGSLSSKSPRVRFSQPGFYSMSLRAWSSNDSASSTRFLVKNNYVIVVNPCTPGATEASTDVSNNRLTITETLSGNQIFNHISGGGTSYQSFLEPSDPGIPLVFGATYDIEMFRIANADTVSRAIFIDFNSDGIFDASEIVLQESRTRLNGVSARFTVPNIFQSYLGTTRLRTVVTYGSTSHLDPCGPGLLAEYKDYKVVMTKSSFPPVITMNGLDTFEIEIGNPYTDAGATAFDVIDGDLTSSIVVNSNVNTSQPGAYTVTYDVINGSGVNATRAVRNVFVLNDATPPVVTLLGKPIDTLEVNTMPYNDPFVSAIDNIDGDVTDQVVVIGTVNHNVIGDYHLTYEARDVQGNLTTVNRLVRVLDRTPPVFAFTTGEKLEVGRFWFDQTTVTDNYWPRENINFTTTFGANGPVRWDVPGQYPVTYRAVDGSGNNREVIRVYEVGDFTSPTILLNTTDTLLHDVGTLYVRVNPTISDNVTSSSNLVTTFSSNLDPNVLGLYQERYTAMDEASNLSEKIRWVRVVDRVAPTIIGNNFCTKSGVDFNLMSGLTIEDNYYTQEELLPLVEIVQSNLNVWFQGYYSISYAVTDPSGNRSRLLNRDVQISDDCEVFSNVNNVNHNNLSVNIYPNPSTGKFSIRMISQQESISEVEIINSVGAIVNNLKVNNIDVEIDITDEPTGIYLVRITSSNGNVSTRRIVKTN